MRIYLIEAALLAAASLSACADPSPADRVELSVVVDAEALEEFTTDLEYRVALRAVEIAVADVEFTTSGEAHVASAWQALSHALIPIANAHPGHYQGGEVIGEMPGAWIVRWPDDHGTELGRATLLTGRYDAANFNFVAPSPTSATLLGLAVEHTFRLEGKASRDDRTVDFEFFLDAPPGRALVGAAFSTQITKHASRSIRFQFAPVDPFEEDTAFDGVDFFALDPDETGTITLRTEENSGDETYLRLRRTLLTHDHYLFTLDDE